MLTDMGRYFHSEIDIKSPWHQVLAAFWQRYPNPYSAHVLTEDVLYREVTPSNRLLSRRLLTKTNRLPGWAERIFPTHKARAVYVLEDSIVDPNTNTLITKTWNLNHNTLMTVVERCLFQEDHSRPSWTKLRREAWISSTVYGLARPIQKSNPICSSTRSLAWPGLKVTKLKPCGVWSSLCPGYRVKLLTIILVTKENHPKSTSPAHHKARPSPHRNPISSSDGVRGRGMK
ncbi:PRELI domain-containing protein 1, mitochondrial-like isoform X1 [Melanotaenia boesemani]|uniref:PRELI domain-containing protein 1, mitochondrial-like isoform X1 n=1 Tax=Melanotaenia boesemani TaxID=1250792 RepID=UPI001C043AE4|nr:PRELI domain-containing protein 1, mitochondrial-like isoform X1 [Melanotaenia boesemani]XP_041842254.1 PRELI domain-containing protein 1, mitochondrial-like isoform X1 [Melanotaenia boesemani]